MVANVEIFYVFKEKELESLAAMDMELQKIAAKLHDNSAWARMDGISSHHQWIKAAVLLCVCQFNVLTVLKKTKTFDHPVYHGICDILMFSN